MSRQKNKKTFCKLKIPKFTKKELIFLSTLTKKEASFYRYKRKFLINRLKFNTQDSILGATIALECFQKLLATEYD
jgi:hypothetical protein